MLQRGTMRKVLDEMMATGQRWREQQVLELFLGLCKGVSVLHSHNPPLVHRDIKCLNILLSDDGKSAVLMDFGSIAEARHAVRSHDDAVKLEEEVSNPIHEQYTISTGFMWSPLLQANKSCSPMYRPPELYDPPIDSELDERTDIWSLGATLYEMCYGKNPFEEGYTHYGASIKLSVLSGRIEFPPKSPYSDELHDLIRRMMSKRLEDRPYCDEVIHTVEHMLPP